MKKCHWIVRTVLLRFGAPPSAIARGERIMTVRLRLYARERYVILRMRNGYVTQLATFRIIRVADE